jgi:hypothetical protein
MIALDTNLLVDGHIEANEPLGGVKAAVKAHHNRPVPRAIPWLRAWCVIL